ncbi:MAG: hypothetical protein WBP10_07680 [Thermoanaerobaculia bacterium]
MNKNLVLCMTLLVLILCLALVSSRSIQHRDAEVALKPAPASPAGLNGSGLGGGPSGPASDRGVFQANGPTRVNLNQVQTAFVPDLNVLIPPPAMPISEAQAEHLRQKAMLMPPDSDIQIASSGPSTLAPAPGVSFEALDAGECCGGSTNTPPDPELAVGKDYVIPVVNVAFKIFAKDGTPVVGATTFASFMSADPNCIGVFDPNAIYDEAEDRYILGIDANGSNYCIAVSANPGDIVNWNLYSIPTLQGCGTFFDYPHIGVGPDLIVLGSNQFAGGFCEGRVWAMDKTAAYAGSAMSFVTKSTGSDGTPMPANYHGDFGSLSGPHWFMTEVFDGCNHNVWSWTNPLSGSNPTRKSNLNLCTATGVTAGFPVNWPQSGGSSIQANDWRGQSSELRDGIIYMTNQTISCNPGSGTVDCVRWGQIDPAANSIVDAGVLGSNGEYRTFANAVSNSCGDMAVGYSKGSSSTFPSTYVTGRLSTDTAGTLQAETLLKAGEGTFTCFDGSPYRWGDYTGMTIDPDGTTFWYLGQYSKPAAHPSCDWSTYIGSFTFDTCTASESIFTDGFESGDVSAWSSSQP